MPKADESKAEKKKGTRLVSDSWCDYIVVSNSLERLAPVAVKKPKAEPKDTTDIPESNPDDPIDLESSPKPLVRTRAEKRKKPEGGAVAQPARKLARKRIGKKGDLDAFAAKLSPAGASSHAESLFPFDDRVPSPPPELPKENLEGEKSVEAQVKSTGVDQTKPASPEVVMVAQDSEKKKSIVEDETPVVTVPSTSAPTPELPKDNVQKTPENVEHQGFVVHDAEEESPIRPDETEGDYYYRTYSNKRASNLHAPVWKLKQGDTFSDWQVCQDWFQGVFPPAKIKFQEEQTHERTYRA
ncbi:hypothetical protein HanHA300_Chr05g0183871 [Helianthus annuus]|nr:hypothetical protein HanHA300_Chr05g0183871 [Helianthus annuus]KAJ0577889.1 hypothetical protein HanIR_Chr05g0241121 [Helianthus annuus]KAJ0747916.1 hypothetical protein HanOQP8_Chr05g0195101 [Helianthus annuus]